jgi:2,3-bisphosphoglycerate-dependent phosphoglycerate mutase
VRFVVIRHGQSTNNLLWETTGSEAGRHPDTPLTEIGHRQAALLAEHVHAVLPWRVDALYTSLMARAVQTAAPIAAALDLPLIGRTDLYEVGGPFDLDPVTHERVPHPGASADELRGISDRLVLPDGVNGSGWWSGPVEDEGNDPVDRAYRLVTDLRATHQPDATLALVSHGYFSQFLFREFMGIDSMPGWVEIHNTSLSLYEDTPEFANCHALRINWTPHLPESLVTN